MSQVFPFHVLLLRIKDQGWISGSRCHCHWVFCSHSDQQIINDTNVPKTATLCMVFGRLLCRGLKAILRIGLNFSSLRPADLTREEFHVASQNPWTFSDNYLPLRYVSSLTLSFVFTLCWWNKIFLFQRDTDHLISIELAEIVIGLKRISHL